MYWKSLLMCVLGRDSGISSWVLFLLGLPASWKHFICSERSEARRLRLTPSIWQGTEEQISLFWFGRGSDRLISRLDHIQGRLGLSSISQDLSDLRRWTILLSKAFFIFKLLNTYHTSFSKATAGAASTRRTQAFPKVKRCKLRRMSPQNVLRTRKPQAEGGYFVARACRCFLQIARHIS